MRRRVLLTLLAALVIVAGHDASAAAADKVLRLGTDHISDFVTTKALRRFADRVEQETGGRLKIDVYDGGQLGQERAAIEQAQFGALDIAKASVVIYSDFVPSFAALSMPYLFRDLDHMWKVMKSDIGRGLLAEGEASQLIGLCWLDAGSRCFYGKKPIHELKDLQGLKIRVPESHMMVAMVEALGSLATPMPSSDMYSALQTGICDVAENNIPRYLDMSHPEVAPHLFIDRHNITPELLVFSKPAWDSLTDEERDAIVKSAAILEDEMIADWAAEEERVLGILKDMGVSIVYPDAAVIKTLRDACQPVYDRYGGDFAELLEKIEATR